MSLITSKVRNSIRFSDLKEHDTLYVYDEQFNCIECGILSICELYGDQSLLNISFVTQSIVSLAYLPRISTVSKNTCISIDPYYRKIVSTYELPKPILLYCYNRLNA